MVYGDTVGAKPSYDSGRDFEQRIAPMLKLAHLYRPFDRVEIDKPRHRVIALVPTMPFGSPGKHRLRYIFAKKSTPQRNGRSGQYALRDCDYVRGRPSSLRRSKDLTALPSSPTN